MSTIVRVTIAVMKHHYSKEVEEKRVYSAYTSIWQFIIKKKQKKSKDRNSNRTGTRWQELMQRPCRGVAYWLASPGLISLPIQDHQPRDGSTHNGLGPLPSITN